MAREFQQLRVAGFLLRHQFGLLRFGGRQALGQFLLAAARCLQRFPRRGQLGQPPALLRLGLGLRRAQLRGGLGFGHTQALGGLGLGRMQALGRLRQGLARLLGLLLAGRQQVFQARLQALGIAALGVQIVEPAAFMRRVARMGGRQRLGLLLAAAFGIGYLGQQGGARIGKLLLAVGQRLVTLAQLAFGRAQARFRCRQLPGCDFQGFFQVALAAGQQRLAPGQLRGQVGQALVFRPLRIFAFAIGGGKVGPGRRQGGLPEVRGGLGDGLRHRRRRGERPRVLDPGAQCAEPGFQVRADRIGRAAADLLAHALDGGTRAFQQQGIGGAPDVLFGDSGGHGGFPGQISMNYSR